MAALCTAGQLHWDWEIRCCHAVSGADTFYRPQQALPLWEHLDPAAKRVCQTGSAAMFYIHYDSPMCTVCVHLIYSGVVILLPERLHVFYMAVNCEWAQVRACVGVVELPAGPGPSTDKLFTNRLSIPELGSTRNPLILASHLPSNTGVGAWGAPSEGGRGWVTEPLEFMIMK